MSNTDNPSLIERLRLMLSGDAALCKTEFARATINQAIEAILAAQPTSPHVGANDLPAEPTAEMLKSVETILQPYAAKLVWKRMLDAAPTPSASTTVKGAPIDMLLFCPRCHVQHIDGEEWSDDPHDIEQGQMRVWNNPPHRSHLCHHCKLIWRPADVPTNGVAGIKTAGKDDSPPPAPATASDAALQQVAWHITSDATGFEHFVRTKAMAESYVRDGYKATPLYRASGHQDAALPVEAVQIRAAAINECVRFIENGSFLHDDAPPKRFSKELVAAMRVQLLTRVAPQDGNPPFPDCRFKNCDLPGQCRAEGHCHHPATGERGATPQDGDTANASGDGQGDEK